MTGVRGQLENINKSLTWIEDHELENREQKFLELIELRRKLRTIERVGKEKPAVAVLSGIQNGKSYLVANLLQKQTTPFRVKDGKGNWVSFWERVSPLGAGMESTCIAIRFTSFDRGGKEAEHPIIVKLLGVADLATILCECYHSCLIDPKFYSEDEIEEVTQGIYEQYSKKTEINQDIFVEDDILDIKNYLRKYVAKAHYLLRSCYFERLALVIRRVPQSEWVSVLKYLWHENEAFTTLFKRLVDALHRLEFAREVYLKDGNLTLVSDFLKCELSAITTEAVFKIEPEYLEDVAGYAFGDMPGQMSSQMKKKLMPKVRKDMWAYADLIDMPNLRGRLAMKEDVLVERPSVLLQMLSREKVTHYFNSNNERHVFNSLFFCNDGAQPSFGEMYRMINGWVETNVGANVMTRKQTICRCGGISPLFVVSIKFNSDMIEMRDEELDSGAALDFRWYRRFKKALYEGSFKGDLVDWFRNWDAEGNTFKNTYLLRDINDSRRNRLFAGYDGEDSSPIEKELVGTPDFYNRLRNSFISNHEVQMFFEDPSKSWDVAATMNNDGSLYIIQNLVVLAKNLDKARKDHFNRELEKIQERYYEIIS